ncbi:alpha-amylase [Heliobacterium gestii]|uniref:Alpha-amylase n=1 Tax=Heliomicrobium gestii TaxID=2699 RepID=A0A845L9S0_HELGE|nr:alpha-amylase family glycosyl hydrolase [Heliomicrobium gestii]MBM7865778.1 glycosidase [Heliomicrobium gestii]MZP42024.1 alpha-amylase [Heliomicrobium gestii]
MSRDTTPVSIESSLPHSIKETDLKPRGRVHPSPPTWRDQIVYFLLPDRFSDGNESRRPLFDFGAPDQHRAPDKGAWMAAGQRFQGGTLRGIASKLDYLQSLGVTTLWLGPIWRQRPDLQTYHGYGIQNFLDVDPRFGTRQDLRDLVDAAHDRKMYVLLDIIYNHSGNNFFYKDDQGQPVERRSYRYAPPYPTHGWRSATGQSVPQIAGMDDGVWPEEFQNIDVYTRAGSIGQWDAEPWEDKLSPDVQFRRGDFFDLKDLNLKPATLDLIIRVYRYWIALSDCDGFRIDTVKHVPWDASRNFCGAIREYAESIGKENFLLLGEVTGGEEMARDYLDIFGRNIDAALDIGEPTRRLAGMVKGLSDAADYFRQYGGHDILGGHRETGRYHVNILDDHDMVGREGKHRFAAHNDIPEWFSQVAHAVGVQLTTLGIPCIYYGTEQAFDGTQDRHDPTLEPWGGEDRYIREAMFGGEFGAFETKGCHFFNVDHPTYLRIAAIARVRNRRDAIGLTLRRGRQYLRETSLFDDPFALRGRGELVAWSRILFDREVLVALNTHGTEGRGAWVLVDPILHPAGSALTYLYRSDWSDGELKNPPKDQVEKVSLQHGQGAVRIDLPPAGMAILA